MYTELTHFLPMNTPKGKGFAFGVIDYSQEHDLIWVVGLHEGGKIWCFPNKEVSLQENISLGRIFVESRHA